MTYHKRRQRIHELMSEAGELVKGAGQRKYELWSTASDDLNDACLSEPAEDLRAAFAETAREFWMRENELHSVKVPQLPPPSDVPHMVIERGIGGGSKTKQRPLRLVTADEFDELVKEGLR